MAWSAFVLGAPLRLPGESVDKEIDKWINDKAQGTVFVAGCFCFVAYFEWYGYLTRVPRHPIFFTLMAACAVALAGGRISSIRKRVGHLKHGRDAERVVGQFLERLREDGGQVFHDIPGEGFNLDHVVISTRGIYAVESKTLSKPWPDAKVLVEGDSLMVAGQVPERNPIVQVTAAAHWLERLLLLSTDIRFLVRGVVVSRMDRGQRGSKGWGRLGARA